MRYLNEEDPFYRYSIHVAPGPARDLAAHLATGQPLTEPGCVLLTSWSNESVHVEVSVFPKNDVALELSPIKGRVEFSARIGTPEALALEDFAMYGSPMMGVDITLTELRAPAGLGGTFGSGRGGFGPPATPAGETELARLVVLGPNGEALQMLPARRAYSVQGLPREGEIRGAETLFTADDGTTVRFRFDLPDGNMTVNITTGDIRGRVVVELLPSLRFLAAFGAPNQFALAQRFGPIPAEATPIPQPPSQGIEWLLGVAECLASLQDLTTEPIRMPDPEALSASDLDGIWQASQLARGVEFVATVPQLQLPSLGLDVGRRVEFARLTPWGFRNPSSELQLGYLVDGFVGTLSQPPGTTTDDQLDTWDVVDQRLTRRLATSDDLRSLPADGSWAVVAEEVRDLS